MTERAQIFDFDNHYYESTDAFTRYQDKSMRSRGVRWAEIDGRQRMLVGGTLNAYIANPTFDPVAKPGSLWDWYRGNPAQQTIVEAFGELDPIRPEYRDRDARPCLAAPHLVSVELNAHDGGRRRGARRRARALPLAHAPRPRRQHVQE